MDRTTSILWRLPCALRRSVIALKNMAMISYAGRLVSSLDLLSDTVYLLLDEIMQGSPLYLFPYWLYEQYLVNTKKLHSNNISKLCDDLGRSQIERLDFVHQRIEYLKPIKGIYYDITSISSYSKNIEFIEPLAETKKLLNYFAQYRNSYGKEAVSMI